jgi:hypothetical protein
MQCSRVVGCLEHLPLGFRGELVAGEKYRQRGLLEDAVLDRVSFPGERFLQKPVVIERLLVVDNGWKALELIVAPTNIDRITWQSCIVRLPLWLGELHRSQILLPACAGERVL